MKRACSFRDAVLAAAIAISSSLYAGKTYYVNCRLGDYAGHDGSTPELAFETIQQAVSRCAVEGDEVVVYPGVYDKGLGRDYAANGHWWRNSRISVGNRDVLIRSTDGAEDTLKSSHWAEATPPA